MSKFNVILTLTSMLFIHNTLQITLPQTDMPMLLPNYNLKLNSIANHNFKKTSDDESKNTIIKNKSTSDSTSDSTAKSDNSTSLSMIIFLIIMVILLFLFFCQKMPRNDTCICKCSNMLPF